MRDRDRGHLHPVMVPLLAKHQLLAAEDQEVGPTELIETHRLASLQEVDFRKGRDAHGNIVDRAKVVTYKRGGLSWHNLTRLMLRCPDCPHESRAHIAGGGGRIAACSAEPFNLGESCICAVTLDRLHNASTWVEVPASLAYHLALRCRGCHPAGTLVGMGAHARLTTDDLQRFDRLAMHGQGLGLRAGADWDGDRRYREGGENDLMHFELAGAGTLEQVRTVLSMKGGELTWPKTAAGGIRA